MRPGANRGWLSYLFVPPLGIGEERERDKGLALCCVNSPLYATLNCDQIGITGRDKKECLQIVYIRM